MLYTQIIQRSSIESVDNVQCTPELVDSEMRLTYELSLGVKGHTLYVVGFIKLSTGQHLSGAKVREGEGEQRVSVW